MIVGVRHALVENPDRVVYARLPGYHLAEEGVERATEMGAALRGAPVRAVYASPLERAVETARLLAAPHGLDIRIDERLLEWSFWVRWQGLPWTDVRSRDPDLLDAYHADAAAACPEDPLERVAERLFEWAGDAEEADPQGLVVGVTHEAPLVAALLVGSGRGLGAYHTTNVPHLGAVRLRPGPAEVVDLVAWASSC